MWLFRLRRSCVAQPRRSSIRSGGSRRRNALRSPFLLVLPEPLPVGLDGAKPYSVVETAGVQHGLRVGLAAEYDQEIADQRGATLVVELDDIALA